MKKYALVIDYKYCTGCHSCEVACRHEKEIEDMEQWGIKLSEFGPQQMNGKWYWNYVAVPSSLCDMCEDRIEAGKQPACVLHCLGKCMEAVKVEDVGAKMAELGGDGVACFLP